MSKKINAVISDDLYNKLKSYSEKTSISMTEILCMSMTQFFEEKEMKETIIDCMKDPAYMNELLRLNGIDVKEMLTKE